MITRDNLASIIDTYDTILERFVENIMRLTHNFQDQASSNRKLLDSIAYKLRKQRNLRIKDFENLTNQMIEERLRRFSIIREMVEESIEYHKDLKNTLRNGYSEDKLAKVVPDLQSLLQNIEEQTAEFKSCLNEYTTAEQKLSSSLNELAEDETITYQQVQELIDGYIQQDLIMNHIYQRLTAS